MRALGVARDYEKLKDLTRVYRSADNHRRIVLGGTKDAVSQIDPTGLSGGGDLPKMSSNPHQEGRDFRRQRRLEIHLNLEGSKH